MSAFKVGDKVRYHPIIGGQHDGSTYTVTDVGELSGIPVAWLKGKRGCVSVRALSACEPDREQEVAA